MATPKFKKGDWVEFPRVLLMSDAEKLTGQIMYVDDFFGQTQYHILYGGGYWSITENHLTLVNYIDTPLYRKLEGLD